MRSELFEYAARCGGIYGTEDFSVFLYSIVKMQKPERIFELGTGLGACSLLMAQAVKENRSGHVWTVDDGRHWPDIKKELAKIGIETNDHEYNSYIVKLIERFELTGYITFVPGDADSDAHFKNKIGLLFSDTKHDVASIAGLMRSYLPAMASVSSIFIDSASTYLPAYLMLELLVQHLNSGKVPRFLLVGQSSEAMSQIWGIVRQSRFTLVHLTESKVRPQNSTAWLKIEPADLQPYPMTAMRA